MHVTSVHNRGDEGTLKVQGEPLEIHPSYAAYMPPILVRDEVKPERVVTTHNKGQGTLTIT